MRKEQGITLISLVVTIIVLIILAGVSINLILGQDGIITKAREAKQNMELAAYEEQEQLNELYSQMLGESSGGFSNDAITKLVEFKREIASAISDMGIVTAENADATTMANNIKSISGASSADKVSYNNTNSGLVSTNLQGAVDELDTELETEISSLNNSLNGMLHQEIIEFTANFDETFHVADGYVDVSREGYTAVSVMIHHTGSSDISPFVWAVSHNSFRYGLKSTWHVGEVQAFVVVTYVKSDFYM